MSPAAKNLKMTIARGRTNCKADRDLVFNGFTEQLQILEKYQIEHEDAFKARLYDIIEDLSVSEEEKIYLKQPWLNELQELEERHIRIRRSVFIGLYSFWEISLMDIANTHTPSIAEAASNSKKSKRSGASDYLKVIYEDGIPPSVTLIDNYIREFRNYMVHGALTKDRESAINTLMETHKEFCINRVCRDYFISNYKGIIEFLTLFAAELDKAENKMLITKNVDK